MEYTFTTEGIAKAIKAYVALHGEEGAQVLNMMLKDANISLTYNPAANRDYDNPANNNDGE